jgi:hypothetical protein
VSDPTENLPVIPDKVVDEIRKGRDVPLEAISPAAAEMAAERAAERARPVHMDSLRPISRAGANRLMTGSSDGHIQRGTLPRAPATRRVIPAPFRREVISLQVPGEPRKTWQYVAATEVRKGDIVPDVGLVLRVETVTRYARAGEVVPVTVHHPDGRTEQQLTKAVLLDGMTEADYRRLEATFGDQQVAVGTDVRLHGPEHVLVMDEAEQVRVFRTEGG